MARRQECVADPLLVDGRAFDLGVYVLVSMHPSQPASLHARVFDDVLLRFCTAPFRAAAAAAAAVCMKAHTSICLKAS